MISMCQAYAVMKPSLNHVRGCTAAISYSYREPLDSYFCLNL